MIETTHTRFLLLQARDRSDPMRGHEVDCFRRSLGVQREDIRTHDLLQGPPGDELLAATDLLLVGGSGTYSVLDRHPFVSAFLAFLDDVVVARGLPTFASCFGFQALVLAGGGEVVRDVAATEVGTYTIHLTAAGRADPLLSPLAPCFEAQEGHKDRAARLPASMTHLAYSELGPYQALRVEGLPIFATQFHPELTRDDNASRYLRYQAGYGLSSGSEADPVLRRMKDSPEAFALLPRWVALTMTSGATRS